MARAGLSALWARVLRGSNRPAGPEPESLSGPARFRQPGTTRVVLESVGPTPHLLVMSVCRTAGVSRDEAVRMIDRTPIPVVEHISLSSAERVKVTLRAGGAQARIELERTRARPAQDGAATSA